MKLTDLALGTTYYTFGKRDTNIYTRTWRGNARDMWAFDNDLVYLSLAEIEKEQIFYRKLEALNCNY